MYKRPSFLQAEIYATEKYAQFNLDRKYKRQNIGLLSKTMAAIRDLGAYKVKTKIAGKTIAG